MELFSANVNDQDLMNAIVSRYQLSTKEIQKLIEAEMVESEIDQLSLDTLQALVKNQTDATLIVKSEDDFWFEC